MSPRQAPQSQTTRRPRKPASDHPPAATEEDFASARARLAVLRDAASAQARLRLAPGSAPIRVMARMVAELEATCREMAIPREVAEEGVVNRTIGDVDLRRVSRRDDGPEFLSLADEMGLALPGEDCDGYHATGERYHWLRTRMEHYERELLRRHCDLRVYDLPATGNPLLRERLADLARREYGISVPPAQVHLSLGSLDGLDKCFRALAVAERAAGREPPAVVFPAPGFNVPEWQATSVGMRVIRVTTRREDRFQLTPDQLREALAGDVRVRAVYLTVSNNPTALAYTPDDLRALADALRGSDTLIFADLAYIGTGEPQADRARMAVFADPDVLERSVLFFSFSKSHTLTGDRLGWVVFGTPELALMAGPAWANTIASLPADWQLHYLARVELFERHPELEERIRALYRHRRGRLARQLERINERHGLFARINADDDGTVYNWSQLRPGEDVFSLFGTTGIAGVPGTAFGYSDDYVRLSVGCVPVRLPQD